MLFLLIFAQTVHLEPVEQAEIKRFETNKYGHFLLDSEGGAFHWTSTGRLVLRLEREGKASYAIHPMPGGYAVTWFNAAKRRFGIDVVNHFGKTTQELPEYLSSWYFEIGGHLYGSAMIWAPGETQIVPIAHDGGKLNPSKARQDFFDPGKHGTPMDPDFKRIWVAETDKGFVVATPLEPFMYHFDKSTKLIGKKALPLPEWKTYKGVYQGGDYREYLKGFNRLVYFGGAYEGFVMAVESVDGKTTELVWWFGDKVVKREIVPGWQREGKIVGGSDGVRVWVLNPDPLTVSSF